jgi:hypothetical protein
MSSIYCKGDTEDTMLLTRADGTSLAQNDNFKIIQNSICTNSNFAFSLQSNYAYFYYAKDKSCISVASGEQTEKLFDYIKIPVLKDEYNEMFDTKFQIVVTAQAIPVASADSSSLDDVKAAFKTKFGN